MSETPIGIWIPHLRIGGAERVALNLAEALRSAGERVDVVVAEQGEVFGSRGGRTSTGRLANRKRGRLPGLFDGT